MSDETSKYRVLIVDDEESMRDFLSIMLHREGYQVDTAVDGAQAVVHLRDHSYDLVISDIKMPRMTGLELLAHIKDRTPETVVLMVTAFSSTDEAANQVNRPYATNKISRWIKSGDPLCPLRHTFYWGVESTHQNKY